MVRYSEDQIPTQLISVWCDNKHKLGAQLQNNKNNLTQDIRLIVPGVAKDGLLTVKVYLALGDIYWTHLIKKLGTHPLTWNSAKPNPQLTPPPRSSQRASAPSTPPRRQAPLNSHPSFCARDSHFTLTLPRRNTPQPYPRREASPRRGKSPKRTQSDSHNYDPRKVEHNRKDSLGILNLPVSTADIERDFKLQYQRLAIIYHPDKYDPTTRKMSKSES